MKLDKNELARKAELAKLMHGIEKDFGGFASIPVNHDVYWKLKNEAGVLQAKENS